VDHLDSSKQEAKIMFQSSISVSKYFKDFKVSYSIKTGRTKIKLERSTQKKNKSRFHWNTIMSTHRPRVPTNFRGNMQISSKVNLDLWDAAHNGDIRGLKLAIQRGGNPDYFKSSEECGPTSLHAAARIPGANGTCTKELIEKGAEVNVKLVSNFNSPLHEAASNGNLDICKILVEAGATVNSDSGNGFGNTPMHTATRAGSLSIVKYLMEHGGDVNVVNNRGSTPLHFCCFLCNKKDKDDHDDEVDYDVFLKIASFLITNGIEVDRRDLNGYTALHVASQRGCLKMVRLLLDSGASLECKTSVDEKGRGGRTPAEMAQFGDQNEVYHFLCNAKTH